MRILAKQAPIVVLLRNPETTVALRENCPLPLFTRHPLVISSRHVEGQTINAVCYVIQNIRKFQMMRLSDPAHVFISHVESEKS